MALAKWPPGPKGRPLIGQLHALRADPLGFLTECARDYGDLVHFKVARRHFFLINHPDYIREIMVSQQRSFHRGLGRRRARLVLGQGLFTSQDEFHLRQRRLTQPAFHRSKIADYAEVIASYSRRHGDQWRAGATYDIAAEMYELTYAIICKLLFDIDVAADSPPIHQALKAMKDLEAQVLGRRLAPFVALLDRMPTPSNRRFYQALAALDRTLYQLIAERRAEAGRREDLLSMLIAQQFIDDNGAESGMSDREVRDEAVNLFWAGHETMASALTWTWYLLAQHPEAEASLHAELSAVLGDRPPTFADIPRLSYTEMVFAESMRLYPPGWIMTRRPTRPCSVGGYLLPAGSVVLLVPYLTHRDARFFEDPTRFEPLRWTPERRAARPRYAYFPFGAGPRRCIGEPLAWMQGMLILATLTQRWRPRLMPDARVKPFPMLTLRAENGMWMRLEARDAR